MAVNSSNARTTLPTPKRLDLYDLETAPLTRRFAEEGLLVRVDGDRRIDDVTESIIAAIEGLRTAAAGRVSGSVRQ